MDSLAQLFPLLTEKNLDIPEVQDGIVKIAWKFCVGENLRNVSDPVRFQDGILKVKVAHHQWKKIFEEMKPEIIGRINKYVRKDLVNDIQLIL
jgi:predicted nucleic acid-binding Zn ribbon protein